MPAETGVTTEPEEWTAFDIGHALQLLHSADEGVVGGRYVDYTCDIGMLPIA